MNNSIRRFVQMTVEVKALRSITDLSPQKNILEIGCGSGYGTQLIREQFQPQQLAAVDLDERMIAKARKSEIDTSITFQVADAAKLPFENETFDAVIDFGIIHHIPNWKDCLQELFRVLKPGGQVIIEDLSLETFQSPIGRILKSLLTHPYDKMYSEKEFTTYLDEVGFKQIKIKRNIFGTLLPAFALVTTKP
jgi:ubiquinone/menaquinone biosynthesis C-methylase UbiE